MSELLVQAAPAKINLALHVTRRRDDGYHDLESLVVFADVADELEARFQWKIAAAMDEDGHVKERVARKLAEGLTAGNATP